MLPPLYLTGLIRADLLRAGSMASNLARNLGLLLDNADRALPLALARFDDLLADDVIRLSSCLHGAQDLRHRLGYGQIVEMALARDALGQMPTCAAPAPQVAA